MKLIKKNHQSIIGIDLGSAAVKIVELKKDDNLPRLVTYGLAVKQREIIYKDPKQSIGYHSEILKQTLAQARVTTQNAVGALPATSVFSTIIELPNMPRKEIGSAVRWEAKKIVPISWHKMSLNWYILPAKTTGVADKKKIKVIISAASRDLSSEYVNIFKKAGLKLLSLETEIKALQRSLLADDDKVNLVIDFGATNTNMIVYDDNLPLINRNVDIGAETIIHHLEETLNIGYEEARRLKEEYGAVKDDHNSHPAAGAIRYIIDNLVVREIKYINNILKETHGKIINKIIIIGGAAHIKNIPAFLENAVQIDTRLGNPWSNVKFPHELKPNLEKIGPQMAVAIGLALKEM